MIYLLIGYMWLFIHRPFEVWPVLADLRIERVYMILTPVAWLASGRIQWKSSGLNVAFAAFAATVVLSWQLSPWSGTPKAQTAVENYLKILVFYLILVTSIRDEPELRLLIVGFLASTGLYMLHSLREFLAGRHIYRMGIARMVGVDSSLGDPNSFSASLLYALPLVIPAWSLCRKRWHRGLVLAYIALTGFCILQTGSRGAFVGLSVFALIMTWKSPHRIKAIVPVVLVVPLLWALLPAQLQNRFTTIIDPSVGPENAQSSAESRAEGWRIGLRLWERFPLTGCGPGAWIPSSGSAVESHNLYGQVVGELGTLGVLTFGAIAGLLFANVRAIRRWYRERPDEPRDFIAGLGSAIGLSLFLLLLEGFGSHSLYRYNWVWYAGFLVIVRECLHQRAN